METTTPQTNSTSTGKSPKTSKKGSNTKPVTPKAPRNKKPTEKPEVPAVKVIGWISGRWAAFHFPKWKKEDGPAPEGQLSDTGACWKGTIFDTQVPAIELETRAQILAVGTDPKLVAAAQNARKWLKLSDLVAPPLPVTPKSEKPAEKPKAEGKSAAELKKTQFQEQAARCWVRKDLQCLEPENPVFIG